MTDLYSFAEKRAEAAENLPAFSGLKLLHIKREISELLGLIGKEGFFSTYTKHDISHIDAMLGSLDWLVPESTKALMSPADWLMVVLAIYFHDLGMLVTSQEYDSRKSSGFKNFCDTVLFAGDHGGDYKAHIDQMSFDQGQRFLYQEFVRHRHPERIRAWITGRASEQLGIATTAVEAVSQLLSQLESQFRGDLALICESHHLDDLSNLSKYPVSRPYGNSGDQTVNLQYVAVLLRSADLLHITGDRTPSIIFRYLNPTDPTSQEEWAKQMAVKCVRAKIGRDSEGRLDEGAPRDTIEVFAHFTKPDGFFGLTSYLRYAAAQIRESHKWTEAARLEGGSRFEFPWKNIDESQVQTAGFLKEAFEFTFDQAKILDLLTGHTLYNDASVVVRELVQNSLDAVRLQHWIDRRTDTNAKIGRIEVALESTTRTLSIKDTGTGMTQKIIEQHLLKVGSSRYQDPTFQKEFPDFSAISRFGIGVLSAFMVADLVEIITAHPEERDARYLTLRSVHGKYLVRLLDKESDALAKSIGPHGTIVRLRLRPSAKLADIVQITRRWIAFPACAVTVSVDNGTPQKVGFASPKAALEEALNQKGFTVVAEGASHRHRVRVTQVEDKGLSLAFALRWSEYFKEWSFLVPAGGTPDPSKDPLLNAIGFCVEGVRVEPTTPGFRSNCLVAVANLTGPECPRTNVARSRLEMTPQLEAMIGRLYKNYCGHADREVKALQNERGCSMTWAVQEAAYLLDPLWRNSAAASIPEALNRAIEDTPSLLVEIGTARIAFSPVALARERSFWTVDSAFFKHAEWLLREVPGAASVRALVGALGAGAAGWPADPILCVGSQLGQTDRLAFKVREVEKLHIIAEHRRLDLSWAHRDELHPRWRSLREGTAGMSDRVLALALHATQFVARHSDRPWECIELRVGEVEFRGCEGFQAARTAAKLFIWGDSPLFQFLLKSMDNAAQSVDEDRQITGAVCLTGALAAVGTNNGAAIVRDLARRIDIQLSGMVSMTASLNNLADAIGASTVKVFDTSDWSREQ